MRLSGAARSMAPAGCKLIEWSHRLSFAYVSGRPPEEEWYALARHILSTGGLLCSSCQVIYLDTDSLDDGRRSAIASCLSWSARPPPVTRPPDRRPRPPSTGMSIFWSRW